MTPNSKEEALAHFKRVWANQSESEIGQAIIDFLSNNIDSKNIPISIFFEITKPLTTHKEIVLNIVSYLAGSDLNLLKINVEFIDKDEVICLDDDAAVAATRHNIDPITGEVDPELSDKIFLCFSPSDLAKSVLRK